MPYTPELEALFDLVAQQLPDNTTGEITPADARQVLGAMLTHIGDLPTGNNTYSTTKVVRYFSSTTPGYDPYTNTALDLLLPEFLCLEATCRIIDPRPGEPAQVILKYTPSGGAVQTFDVWRDGSFAKSTVKSSAAWYDIASLEAARARFRRWAAGVTDWLLGETLTYTLAGTEGFYETKFAGGPRPAPTGPDDANYRQVAPPMSPAARSQELSPTSARLLLRRGGQQVQAGFPYVILRDGGNVTVLGVAPDAGNSLPGVFSPTGVWQTPTGPVAVTYDVTNDTPVPITNGVSQRYVDDADAGLDVRLDEVEADLTFAEQEITDLQNELPFKADLINNKVPLPQIPPIPDAVEALRRISAFAVRYTAQGRIYYDTPAQLMAAAQPGETVRLLGGLGNTGLLTLKNGVTYQTGGEPTAASGFTDNGAAVTASVLGGSPFNAARRTVVATNAATRLRIDADLYADLFTGAVVRLAAAQLIHNGQLIGYGASQEGINLSGGARYELTGRVIGGGSTMARLIGATKAVWRMPEQAIYNFRQLIDLSDTAEMDVYGGARLTVGEAGTFVNGAFSWIGAIRGSSILRLKSGVFNNSQIESFYLENTPTLVVSSAASIPNPTNSALYVINGTGGTVKLHAGCTVDRARISPSLTVIELLSDAPEGIDEPDTYQAQIADIATKFNAVIITAPRTFAVTQLFNTPSWIAQVINPTNGTAYGPQRTAAADINTDLATAWATAPVAVQIIVSIPSITDAARLAFVLFTLS